MEINEARSIIGNYMGLTVYPMDAEIIPQSMSHVRIDFINYDKSLDSQIPVWEKANIIPVFDRTDDGEWICSVEGSYRGDFVEYSRKNKDMRAASCLATAEYIKEELTYE